MKKQVASALLFCLIVLLLVSPASAIIKSCVGIGTCVMNQTVNMTANMTAGPAGLPGEAATNHHLLQNLTAFDDHTQYVSLENRSALSQTINDTVNIGLSTPGTGQLNIMGDSTTPATGIHYLNSQDKTITGLRFYNKNMGADAIIQMQWNNNVANGYLQFFGGGYNHVGYKQNEFRVKSDGSGGLTLSSESNNASSGIDFRTSASALSRMFITPAGNVTIAQNASIANSLIVGGTSPNQNASLQIDSTTKAFLPPRMTTTQRNAITSPVEGMQIYDLTNHTISFYNGSAWVNAAWN